MQEHASCPRQAHGAAAAPLSPPLSVSYATPAWLQPGRVSVSSQPQQDVVDQRDGQRDEHAEDDTACTSERRVRQEQMHAGVENLCPRPLPDFMVLLRSTWAGCMRLRRAEDVGVHAVLLGEDEGDNALGQRCLRKENGPAA